MTRKLLTWQRIPRLISGCGGFEGTKETEIEIDRETKGGGGAGGAGGKKGGREIRE